MRPPRLTRAAACALWALSLPAAAGAQVVSGRVLDADARTPIAGAEVSLRAPGAADVLARSIADDSGSFRLVVPRAGDYMIAATSVGHVTMEPARVTVAAGEGVEIEVRLSRHAIPLDPLTVVARRADVAQDATFEGALARHAAFPTHGTRRVVLRTDPEYHAARELRDVLNWMPSRRDCVLFFWNGRRSVYDEQRDVLTESAHNFEAVEFYRSLIDAPLGFREQLVGAANPFCTVIALWPRQQAPPAQRTSVLRLVAGLAALALLLVVLQ